LKISCRSGRHSFSPGSPSSFARRVDTRQSFDGGKDPLHIVASGHGADDADALNDLLTTLKERNEATETITYVSEALGLTERSSRSRLMLR
jgi:hypothetical protein